MRIGKFDTSIKHINFESNGEEHFVSFSFSHRKGISDVFFDGGPVKITDAYPPLMKAIKISASIILSDAFYTIRKSVVNKFARNK